MSNRKYLRAAIIGLGQVGYGFDKDPKRKIIWTHFNAYRTCPRYRLAAVCDLNTTVVGEILAAPGRTGRAWRDRRSLLPGAGHPEIRGYSDHRDMLRANCLDVVSVCTPEGTHFKVVRDILKHGRGIRAVFCEKPLADTSTECRALVKECAKRRILLAVNYGRRWNPPFLELRDRIRSGEFGKLRSLVGWYYARIFRVGTHMIDLMRMLAGDIVSVSGLGESGPYDEPSCDAVLTFRSGARGYIIATGDEKHLDFDLELNFEKAKIRVLQNGIVFEHYDYRPAEFASGYLEPKLRRREKLVPKVSFFVKAVENIAAALDKKEELSCSGRDGLAAVAVAEAVVKSFRKGGRPERL